MKCCYKTVLKITSVLDIWFETIKKRKEKKERGVSKSQV